MLKTFSDKLSSESELSLSMIIPLYRELLVDLNDKLEFVSQESTFNFNVATFSISANGQIFDDFSMFDESTMNTNQIESYEPKDHEFDSKTVKMNFIETIID